MLMPGASPCLSTPALSIIGFVMAFILGIGLIIAILR